MLAKAVIADVSTGIPIDSRPFATVTMRDHHLVGLLDSGASVSCFGRNGLERVQQLGLSLKKVSQSDVLTADGSPQRVHGLVEVEMSYGGKTKRIRLYVIPSLSQELYLGIDFWQEFGIAPRMVEELNSVPTPGPVMVQDPNTHELTPDQKQLLEDVKASFPSCELEGLGKTSVLRHQIDVGATNPIKQRHYFVSPAVQAILNAEVDSMLARGIIEESRSAWSSPVLVVKKANGKLRFCLDCRAVNKVTVKDAYPMPLIDSILANLHETTYISSIDLKDAFWQIELEEASRDKTAFTVPGRPLYQFKRMPFGLCNAPQTMCRLMDRVIPQELRSFVFVYMDDLLVVSQDFGAHMDRLRVVARCLREANLTINVAKSKFCMKEIRYLGHLVSNGTIKPDPGKVEAITNYPVPRNVRQVRSFLGMCGWYQRYISGYAAIASPITDLLGKHDKFEWSSEANEAFEKLKVCMSTAPVLSHPDFSKPFTIQCDASKTGVGGVLFQLDESGGEHPIAFMSRKLNSAQRNYSVTEQECLAAILSLKKFRGYVEGHAFRILTDHASLKWLMTQKDLSGRLARWSLKLQGFDFEIEHRKGSANVVPDALSRGFVEEVVVGEEPNEPIDLGSEAFDCDGYRALRNRIEAEKGRLPDLQVRGRLVYLRTQPSRGDPIADAAGWKLWVPVPLQGSVIEFAHNPPLASHPGVGKTLEKLQRTYFWPKMAASVRNFVSNCIKCKESKAPNGTLRPLMGRQVLAERPWQRLYTDLLGPYPRSKAGNTSILIVLDQFSKFVLLKPLRKATAKEVCRYLEEHVFHLFGVPESVWSDNGVQFVSREFKSMLTQYGVTHIRTASHSPQSNASERVNRSILAAIRSYISEDQQTWDDELSAIGSALRNNTHESTGYSPHYLVFGQHFVQHGSCYRLMRELEALPDDGIEVLPPKSFLPVLRDRVRTNLDAAYKRHERAYNLRGKTVDFRPGQEVYRRNFHLSNFAKGVNAKLGKQWLKSRVVCKVGSSMYELEDMDGKKLALRYHGKDLKQ